MCRVYFNLGLFVAVIFLTLALAARALGGIQPPNPALRGFVEACGDKGQPCWFGIVPGETTFAAAQRTLNEMGYSLQVRERCCADSIKLWETNHPYYLPCSVRMETHADLNTAQIVEVVHRFALRQCRDIQLGDLFLRLNNPILIYECPGGDGQLTFNRVLWINRLADTPNRFSRAILVDEVVDNISAGFFDWAQTRWQVDETWYGFMPEWKLRQIITDKYC
jgi:hypothetical protein